MNFKRYVDWACAIVIGLALGAVLAGPAHADTPTPQDVHSRRIDPGTNADWVYVFDDPVNKVVCYETGRGAISCVPRKSL